jgi:hypothetical protein
MAIIVACISIRCLLKEPESWVIKGLTLLTGTLGLSTTHGEVDALGQVG